MFSSLFNNLYVRTADALSGRHARRGPGSPEDVAEFHAALWRLQEVAATENDRAEVTAEDRLNTGSTSKEFEHANRCVIETERYVSAWQEWAVRDRVAAGVLPEDVRVLLAGE